MTTDEKLSDLREMGSGEGRDRHYFAEIAIVDDYDCVLQKGSGKLPFEPAFHRPEQRRVNVAFTFVCTKADGTTYTLTQDDITSGSKHKVLLTSLEALGVETRAQLRALVGQYAELVRVPTGQKYTARKDSADGSIKAGDILPETAYKVLRLFPDAEQARAAEAEFYTPRNGGETKNAPQPVTAAELGSSPTIDAAARDALLKTLPVLWQAAQRNADAFKAILTTNPGYAAVGLTFDSPDVQAVIAA